MSEYICVFDCETLPDVGTLARTLPEDLVKSATDKNGKIDEKALSLLACEEQRKNSGQAFLPVLFH